MYFIALCEDKPSDLALIEKLVRTIMRRLDISYKLERFTEPAALMQAIDAGSLFHLLILDILFDGPEGIKLAVELRNRQLDYSIIFISSSQDFTFEGYDVHAVSYLLKPPDPDKLERAIRYAYRHGPTSMDRILIKHRDGIRLTPLEDILFLQSDNHDILVRLVDGTELRLRGKLKELAGRLPVNLFVQCHKSVCVNLHHVKSVHGDRVVITGEEELSISRGCREEFLKTYFSY